MSVINNIRTGYKRVWNSAGPFKARECRAGLADRTLIAGLKIADMMLVPLRPEGTVLENIRVNMLIERQLTAYLESGDSAKARNAGYLEKLFPLIREAHSLITPEQAGRLGLVLDNIAGKYATVTDILAWMRQNTPMKFMAIGDEWSAATKGDSGDGSWGAFQKPEDRLGLRINREEHMKHMALAAAAIIEGDYGLLYNSVYQNVCGDRSEKAAPNLKAGILEAKLEKLQRKSFPQEMLRPLYLAAVLHDYGRILKDKVKLDPNDTRPDASQHRIAGSYMAEDLLIKLGFDPFQVEFIKLLIKQHDTAWCLYCLDKFGDRNNFTTAQSVDKDIEATIKEMERKDILPKNINKDDLKGILRKGIIIVGIADVYASADRYLSDNFINNAVSYLSKD